MKITESQIQGLFEIDFVKHNDERGHFVKVFNSNEFRRAGLASDFAESYYSESNKHVVRGLHFQKPPSAHAKFVYCIRGAAIDIVLDLRKQSSTFLQYVTFDLNSENAKGLYIPLGCAHGFFALEDHTTLVYHTTTVYNANDDAGIRWDSIPYEWPSTEIIVSKRDQALPRLENFESPF